MPDMKIKKINIAIILAIFLSFVLISGVALGNTTQIRIGVLSMRGQEICMKKWAPTAKYLTARISGKTFVIVPLDFDKILPSVEKEDCDFVLANPSFYVELESRFGAERIATLKNLRPGHAYTQFGGVVFCRADRKDISSFNSLKGKNYAAPDPNSFGAWIAVRRELKSAEIDPYGDFKSLKFVGTMDAVVSAVRDGKADAGSVRTDTLERMAMEGKINIKDFRVIGARDQTKTFPFVHSTRLYPEWPFASVKHTSHKLAEQVAVALIDMPQDSTAARAARCAGWTIPLNYQHVHECLKGLKLGPYKDLGKVTFTDVFRNYWYLILATFALFIAMAGALVAYFRLNQRIKMSHANLQLEIEERKRAEEALLESEESYRAVVENSHDGILIVGEDYRFLYVNDKLCEILGRKNKEIIGHDFKEFLDEDSKKLVADRYIRRQRGEEVPSRYEFNIVKGNGEKKWVEISSAVVNDSKGKIRTIAQLLDITERKQAEEALRESEEKYRSLTDDVLDSSNVGIFILDSEFKVVWVNQALERYFGLRRDEVIGKGKRQLIRERIADIFQDSENFAERVLATYESNTYIDNFECHVLPDGDRKERWLEHWSQPIRKGLYAGGRVEHYTDITERTRAEDALRESEQRLSFKNRIAHIFLTVPDEEMYGEVLHAVLEVAESRAGIFGYINEKGAWVCPSLTRDIWDKCRISDKDIEFPREQWGGIWGKAMVEKKPLYSNKPFRVPEGHISILRALDMPIVHQGKLIGNLLVGNKKTDYTQKDKELLETISEYIAPVLHARLQRDTKEREKNNLEAQLRQAQKMEAIGVLAGGVAHDFNNLLTGIIGNADLALMDLGRNTCGCQYIEEIRKAGQRAASLTRQLLAFSRKELIRPEILDLKEVTMNLEKMLRRLIGEDIELVTAYAPDPWLVEADPGQMEQVILNLSVNARDAMPKGGKLTIETANVELDEKYFREHGVESKAGPYVMLAVTDSGIGMDKDIQARIFEPFFTTKERGRGTGLGLSTVYGIVKQNNGYILVYSEPEKGTTFKIYLPRADTDIKGEEEEQSPRPPLGGSETILVVDDDEMLHNMAKKMLEGYGYRVLTARDGKTAMEISGSYDGPIHLLLTDVVMPRMSGREMAIQLQSRVPEIKVLYMSGYPDNTIAHHGVLEKDVEFIQKPFTREGLAGRVRKVLDKK